ncbi:unnamed protein product [Miscanthus lutarioriparius]|uniref:Uncharacterized protein n=1 Tax=Miscanthus lutarioriparius TaxID=422564 RepID=A0A811SKK9_9POAL|nr:unnamed protein product [Miscanthus lutarioriparius]
MRRLSIGLLLLAVFTESVSASGSIISSSGSNGEQDYIVYLGHLPSSESDTSSEPDEGSSSLEAAHHDLLNQILDDGRIIRSYKRSLNGFAARLTEQQANKLADMEGVMSVFPSKTHELQTTGSWDFLGTPQPPQEELALEGDVIIGILDTGIWLDSPSFSDDGFGPPPSRWKGDCQNFTCNNKLIGARLYHYYGGTTGLSPVDKLGHGSHTASTAAGQAVGNVSFGGLATGVARGAVPGARLAIYKVCWDGGSCWETDMLAAFDIAIADAVDVISISIGEDPPLPARGWLSNQYISWSALAGAAGAIAAGAAPDAAFIYPLPTLVVSENQFDEIMAYANSTSNPVGTIETTVTTVNAQAPMSASFSSPGPNIATPDILKVIQSADSLLE